MALPDVRYVACLRCAVEHPDDAATPIAAYGAFFIYGWSQHVDLLWRVVRRKDEERRLGDVFDKRSPEDWEPRFSPSGRPQLYWRTAIDAQVPLAQSPETAVPLRCRRCGLKIGPISAKRVGQLFTQGADYDGVLLLPRPPAGVEVPRPRRVSVARATGRAPGP